VANAVDAVHPGIQRRPANSLRDDSDLGDIAVTVDVPLLPEAVVRQALAAGLAKAEALRRAGLLWSATLVCQGQWAQTRSPAASTSADTPVDVLPDVSFDVSPGVPGHTSARAFPQVSARTSAPSSASLSGDASALGATGTA
jgi:hypothetical protein